MCSYECSGHEAKARERREELDAQAKELQTSLEQFEGMIHSIFFPTLRSIYIRTCRHDLPALVVQESLYSWHLIAPHYNRHLYSMIYKV